MSRAKIPAQIFLGITALLMAYHDDAAALQISKPAWHCFVIADVAITMQLQKILKRMLYIIEHVRALSMAGDLHPLPGREIAIHIHSSLGQFVLNFFHFAAHLDIIVSRLVLQLRKLAFEIHNRFFEFEWFDIHNGSGFNG